MNCSHCGDKCDNSKIKIEEHIFCCNGCKTVFELLNENDLCEYYDSETTPGIKIRNEVYYDKFNILDEPEVSRKFILYEDSKIVKVKFSVPQVHCSSCIWLLENLNRLNPNINNSEVNFQKKEILITFEKTTSVKEVAILIASIGYEPVLTSEIQVKSLAHKTLVIKIGIAGFCFGNIMLFAFPEYLGLEEKEFSNFFGWLSMFLALPVMFYAGVDYLKSALKGFRQRFINMDIPIALGMITLFVRSAYEIISETGAGYFDSLSGLIFFLLIGKWFQSKTYDTLSFERNYKSYFPLSVGVKKEGEITSVKLENLKVGDEVVIRNQEIIPADSILQEGNASVDYSFVTGESDYISVNKGEKLYAGGKHNGKEITVILTHKPDNSYLTQLWNSNNLSKEDKTITKLADTVSHYFTIIIISITLLTFLFWFFVDASLIWNTVTSVLIIACPCALAMTIPFTLGNAMRFLGRKSIYVKNIQVIENLSKINHVVFDKTGTLTQASEKKIYYTPVKLDESEINIQVKSLVTHSSHPLSVALNKHLKSVPALEIDDFKEIPNKGVEGLLAKNEIFIGKYDLSQYSNQAFQGSTVAVVINEELVGFYTLTSTFREGIKSLVQKLLQKEYKISLISGDSEADDIKIKEELGIENRQFNCAPLDKLNFVKAKQKEGDTIVMIGDGLNDAGALMESSVGIAVSDDVNYFVPACDTIMSGAALQDLEKLLLYSKISIRIIWAGFTLSFIYNVIGLSFAVSGALSPIVAAVLMPLSSITIVAFTSLTTRYYFKKLFKI